MPKFAFTIDSSLIEMLIGRCVDLDDWKTDSDGSGCYYYDHNPNDCGAYDHADFKAKQLCCSCGGGGSMHLFIEFNLCYFKTDK